MTGNPSCIVCGKSDYLTTWQETCAKHTYGDSKKLAIKDACDMLSQMIKECEANNYSVKSEFVEQFVKIEKGDRIETGRWTPSQIKMIDKKPTVTVKPRGKTN